MQPASPRRSPRASASGPLITRAETFAELRFAADTSDESRGALAQRATRAGDRDRHAAPVLRARVGRPSTTRAPTSCSRRGALALRERAAPERRYRPHVLTEPEERIDTEKASPGRAPGCGSSRARRRSERRSRRRPRPARRGAARLAMSRARTTAAPSQRPSPPRSRRACGRARTSSTRSSTSADRGPAARLPALDLLANLSNEISDEAVDSLVEALTSRYDIPQRYYRAEGAAARARQLDDYDRFAPLGPTPTTFCGTRRATLVLDAFVVSPERGRRSSSVSSTRRGSTRPAPGQAAGRVLRVHGAVHHPYMLLNWTGARRDVLTLAHELGHGLHAYLARPQGVFHQRTPLTLAETASVFGETVDLRAAARARATTRRRGSRCSPSLEDQFATVFRQIAMNRFEDAVHTDAARATASCRSSGSASSGPTTQRAMLGDSVEVTEGYRTWWSYIPHFIAHARLRLRVRVRLPVLARHLPPLRQRRATRSSSRSSTCCVPVARRRPASWPGGSASTSRTPGSGRQGWTRCPCSSTRQKPSPARSLSRSAARRAARDAPLPPPLSAGRAHGRAGRRRVAAPLRAAVLGRAPARARAGRARSDLASGIGTDRSVRSVGSVARTLAY